MRVCCCLIHFALFALAFVANFVRHTKFNTPGLSYFLTVHTLAIELASTALATCECVLREMFGRAPTILTAIAHGTDAFVLGLGIFLFAAYYLLVHRGERWQHYVHAPTPLIPLAGLFAKPPTLLRAHAAPREATLLVGVVYAASYAYHVSHAPAPPYPFLERLKTRRARLLFWGTGILVGVIPLVLASHTLVLHTISHLASYRRRPFRAVAASLITLDLFLASGLLLEPHHHHTS